MSQKKSSKRPILFIKGMAMGAADVVPGVSGGTIAFITGIYEELIATIHNFNLSFFKVWKSEGFIAAWKAYNLSFLLILVSGILTSILSLAKLITWLLDTHPVLIYAFIVGLILASVYFVGKQIRRWRISTIVLLVLFTFVGYYITIVEPMSAPDSYWFLFLSGAIGIIAMILPGISGSFILLLLGSYQVVLSTVNDFRESITSADWELFSNSLFKLLVLVSGMIVGIKVFSRVLTWLFKNHHDITLAVLTGLMIGAMNKIWPWKETVSTYLNSKGEEMPLMEKSILPGAYQGDPQVFFAIILIVTGFLSIFLIEKIAMGKTKKQ